MRAPGDLRLRAYCARKTASGQTSGKILTSKWIQPRGSAWLRHDVATWEYLGAPGDLRFRTHCACKSASGHVVPPHAGNCGCHNDKSTFQQKHRIISESRGSTTCKPLRNCNISRGSTTCRKSPVPNGMARNIPSNIESFVLSGQPHEAERKLDDIALERTNNDLP